MLHYPSKIVSGKWLQVAPTGQFDFPAVLLFTILIIVIGWYDYWLQILEPENSSWKASSLFLYEASIIFCESRDPEMYSVKQPRATVSTVSSRNKLCLKWDMKNRFNGFLRYFIVRYPASKALKCPLHAMSLLSSSANLMWCWLQWLWPRACCCCSGWHYSEVAGTSPSDAPRDQPDPARCSPLCKYRREKYLLHLFMQLWWLLCLSRCVRIKQNKTRVVCHVCCSHHVYSPWL